MFGRLATAFDRFRGSGAAAVTIPSLDGAFRPNQMLDAAPAVITIEAPDNIVANDGNIYFSSGSTVFALKYAETPAQAEPAAHFDHAVTSLDVGADGAMAVGLARSGVFIHGGAHHGVHLNNLAGRPLLCPTAVRFADQGTLIVCLGSQQCGPPEWKHDLLDGNASGSVWRVDVGSGRATCLGDRLAWPYCAMETAPGRVVIAESWRHQLVDLAGGRSSPLLTEIPGYPARLAPAAAGGYWLAIFAPRSQLVEFVLREPKFRRRMMREVEPEFWVAPSLHHSVDYREPLQSGAIKQLGELKPWAPSRSYGLISRLDESFNPLGSFHSRANGTRHGITSCAEVGGRLLATSKGGNVIVDIEIAPAKEANA